MPRTKHVRASVVYSWTGMFIVSAIAALAQADPAPTYTFTYNVQFAQNQINPWNKTIGQPLNETLFLGTSWNTSVSGGDIWKDPLFGTHWGAEFSAEARGRVGLDFNLESDRSYVNINYNNNVRIDVWDEGSRYRLQVNAANQNTDANPTVTSALNPIIRLNAVLESYARVNAELCLGGCVSGGLTLMDFNVHPTIFTINENYDGYARPFGLDIPGLKKQMQSQYLTIPLSTNPKVTDEDGNPLKNPFAVQYGNIKLKIPNLSGQSSGNGLTAVSADDHLLSLNADLLGIASIAAGLPLNPFDVRYDIGGGIEVRGNLLTVLAGIKFGLKQQVDFNPNMKVMLRSDVNINFKDGNGTTLNTDKPDTLTVTNLGQNIYFDKPAGDYNIFPEIRLDSPTLHNDLHVTTGFNFQVEALRLGLSWKSLGPSIGPVFSWSLDTPQADLGSVFSSDLTLGPDSGLLQRKIYNPILGTGPIARDFVAGDVVVFSGKNGVFNSTSIAGTVSLTNGSVLLNFNKLNVSGTLSLQDNLTYMRTQGLDLSGQGTLAVFEGAELDTTDSGGTSNLFNNGAFDAGKTLILGGGKLTYSGSDLRVNNGAIYVTGVNASGSNIVNIAGGAHSGLRYMGTNNGKLVVDEGLLETQTNFINTASGVMKVVNGGVFRSVDFENRGDLEVSNNGRVEASGQWKNVDANGVLSGNYTFGRGTIAYNGTDITKITGTVRFIGGAGASGNYIENNGVNGLANLQYNAGLLHIETPQNGDVADVSVSGNFTNMAGAKLEVVGSQDIDRGIFRVGSRFYNYGEVVVGNNGQIWAGDIGNMQATSDDFATFTGGKWTITGMIFYSGHAISQIGAGTELNILGGGFSNDQGIGVWHLQRNYGTLNLLGGQGYVRAMSNTVFQNFGTFTIGNYADFEADDLSNSGTLALGQNAELRINGLQDYDNDSNPIPGSLRWHAVDADGTLHGMGNFYVGGLVKYVGPAITTIGADTTLTLGLPHANNYFQFLTGTNQGQNALQLQTVQGKLYVADQATVSSTGLLTVESGGTIGTATDGAIVLLDGSTLHMKGGSTIDNRAYTVMYASTNGNATLRASGGNVTLTGSGYLLTSDSLGNLIETQSNGRLINQDNVIAGGATIHADLTNRGEIRAAGEAGIVFEKTASMTGNIINSGKLVGYGARTVDITSSGDIVSQFTPGKLTLKDLNITNFEGNKQGIIEASDQVVLDHTTVTGGIVRSVSGGLTTFTAATLNGGVSVSIAPGSSASFTAGTANSLTGNLNIDQAGSVTLEQGATLSVLTGSVVNNAGGIGLSHSSVLTSAVTLTNTGIIGTLSQTSQHVSAKLDAGLDNRGTLLVNENTTLTLKGGAINNAGSIVVLSDTAGVSTLRLTANTTLTGGGEVDLGGARDTNNNGTGAFLYYNGILRADAGEIALDNVDNTITGRGHLGEGTMTINNQAAGVIEAVGNPANPLIIETSTGGLTNAGTLRVSAGSRMNVTGGGLTNLSATVLDGGTYDVAGTLQLPGDITRTSTNTTLKLSHSSAAVLNATGSSALANYHQNDGNFVVKGGATFTNDLTNNNTIHVGDGGKAGNITGTITNNGSVVFDNADVGNFDALLAGPGTLTMNGPGRINLTADNASYTGALTVNGGAFALAAGAKLGSDVTVNTGGTLGGFGEFLGSVTNNGGSISPGASPGTLSLASYTQNSGNLLIEIAGLTPGLFDVLDVTGNASLLGGSITFSFLSGFLPQSGDDIIFLLTGGTLTLDPSVTFNYTGAAAGFTFDVFADEAGLHFHSTSNAEAIPQPPAVPEPSSIALLMFAATATLRRSYSQRRAA